ncbi:MAG TPA: glycosyltransferase [Solirubrobacteraceae bacterium]|nr:glycosyltransferase [Solirubrobacteraceae bacterium]
MSRRERISLVATVLNEADSIRSWLASIERQTRQPDELVLVDAGSSDGTLEQVAAAGPLPFPVRTDVAVGANVPEGRNRAFELATGTIVAVTDAGTTLEPTWLERLLAPIEGRLEVAVSAGFFAPGGDTPFERLLATVITPRLRDVDPEAFLPSSRSVAVRREWWERAGGYPAWLRAGEDLVFDLRLKEQGARFAFAPDAVVRWRPRSTLRGYFAQYRHYARGDGHGLLWPGRHAARYGAYGLAVVLSVAARRRPAVALALPVLAPLHLTTFWRRVREERPFPTRRGMLAAYALTPAIVVVGDVAKMIGYPQGRWERWRSGGEEGLRRARLRSHRAPGAPR